MITLTKFDRRILVMNRILIGLLILVTLSPLLYVLIASFMDPTVLRSQGLSLNPANWSMEGYKRVLQDPAIVRGFVNSIFYSTAYSVLTVGVSILTAYPLSKKKLVGKRPITIFLIITMFLGGGLVPTYLLVKNLGMLNTVWAIILPGTINIWNIILARTYFQQLPDELEEAAIIDGANEMQIFFKIMLPLAKPIIFVLFLYAFVGQWNSYFDAMIYLNDADLQPLQLVLRKILIQNQPQQDMIGSATQMAEMAQLAELIKYSTIVISSLPLLIMYPFFQKYFDKGMMAGSLKG